MNARARLRQLERTTARQRIKAQEKETIVFAYYGSPEATAAEAAARKRGEKIPCFDYGQRGGE